MSRRRGASGGAAFRRIRVGFITPNLNCGGAERWILSLCKHLPRDRIDVVGIFANGDGTLAPQARQITELYRMSAHTRIEEAHPMLHRCDVLLVWGVGNLNEIAWNYSGRVVAVSHGAPELPWASLNGQLMQPYATHLAAVSEDAARIFTDGRPVEVIHNGAEADRAAPRRGRQRTREVLGLPADALVAYYGGRLSPEKRPWICRDLLDTLPHPWHAIIAGPNYAGVQIAPHPRLRLMQQFDSPGDYLAAADVFVLPSLTEGFGIAMLEAMLAEVPIVCSHWPVVHELADVYGIHCTTVPVAASPAQWARAVLRATTPAAKAAAQDNRRVTWDRLTAPAMAEQWAAYIERVVA